MLRADVAVVSPSRRGPYMTGFGPARGAEQFLFASEAPLIVPVPLTLKAYGAAAQLGSWVHWTVVAVASTRSFHAIVQEATIVPVPPRPGKSCAVREPVPLNTTHSVRCVWTAPPAEAVKTTDASRPSSMPSRERDGFPLVRTIRIFYSSSAGRTTGSVVAWPPLRTRSPFVRTSSTTRDAPRESRRRAASASTTRGTSWRGGTVSTHGTRCAGAWPRSTAASRR